MTTRPASHPPPHPPSTFPRSPFPRTHSARVKALSPSGTAVSPFPEQSTRRSPSQLQGAAHRDGAAPLGSLEPRSPRARKHSSPSGPGIAAIASAPASPAAPSLGAPPLPSDAPAAPGRPACGWEPRLSGLSGGAGSAPSTVRGSSAGTRRCGVSPFPLLHGSAEAALLPRRLRPAGPAGRRRGDRALPSQPPRVPGLLRPPLFKVAERSLQPCRLLAPAPARLSHQHPGACSLSLRRGSTASRPFPF